MEKFNGSSRLLKPLSVVLNHFLNKKSIIYVKGEKTWFLTFEIHFQILGPNWRKKN